MEYLLSICIPNYNRINSLEKLLKEVIKQIYENNLQKRIQICISDDASKQNPDNLIYRIILENPLINIIYKRNLINRGMDYNFLDSVLLSCADYCWIIGNDDMLESNAITNITLLLEEAQRKGISIIVTPFKVYSSDGDYRYTVRPLKGEKNIYNWLNPDQKENFINNINHESALFAFLSNTIVRRKDWINHGDMFSDKMNSLFIQMYMNLQTMIKGESYLYVNLFIIKNYLDLEPEDGFGQRMYRIAIGLYNVIGDFFVGEEQRYLQEKLVTPFLIDDLWENLDKYNLLKSLNIKKAIIYNKYYVRKYDLLNTNDISIIIFGAGKKGIENVKYLKKNGQNIIMFVDNDLSVQDTIIEGIPVKNAERIRQYKLKGEKLKIIVSSYNIDILIDMIKQIEKLGINEESILII